MEERLGVGKGNNSRSACHWNTYFTLGESKQREKRRGRKQKVWILENMLNKFEAFLEGEW